MKIAIRADTDSSQTNLFTVPQEIYKYIYDANIFSQAIAKGLHIFIALCEEDEEPGSVNVIRVFILQHKSKVDNFVYSCELIHDDEEPVILAKAVIQTEILHAFIYSEDGNGDALDSDEYCKKLEGLFLQWCEEKDQ